MAGIHERFKTTKHTFTRQMLKTGQAVHRKNGRFTSSRSFKSGVRHAVERTPPGTLRMMDKKDRLQVDIARTVDGVWIAGKDASEYLPYLKEGQELSAKDLTTLRTLRGSERNFFSFWNSDDNFDLEWDEAKEKYARFLKEISAVDWNDKEGRAEILARFGWDGY